MTVARVTQNMPLPAPNFAGVTGDRYVVELDAGGIAAITDAMTTLTGASVGAHGETHVVVGNVAFVKRHA